MELDIWNSKKFMLKGLQIQEQQLIMLLMNKFTQIDKILLMGRSGCGKTLLGKKFAEAYPRQIIFDSLDVDEYPHSETDIYSWDKFAEVIRYLQQNNVKKFRYVVKFDTSLPDTREIFDHYMKLLYHFTDCLIVIEEVQDYCDPYNLGRWFKKCMTSGRHKDLAFIFTTQRPSFLHKTVMSQSTHIFVGNLIDKNDTATVSGFMNCDKKEISGLDDHEFLWFHPKRKPHTVKIKNKVDFRK